MYAGKISYCAGYAMQGMPVVKVLERGQIERTNKDQRGGFFVSFHGNIVPQLF